MIYRALVGSVVAVSGLLGLVPRAVVAEETTQLEFVGKKVFIATPKRGVNCGGDNLT